MGAEPEDGLRNARIHAAAPGQEALDIPLSSCGAACFSGQGRLTGDGLWHLEASLASNRGPIQAAVSVPLPAGDGAAELNRAVDAMESLHSARLKEDLSAKVGSPIYESRFAFVAPDAFTFSVGGTTQINIGRRSFIQEGPGGPWKASERPALSWPGGYYRSFWRDAAIRVIGTEDLDGVPSRVVTFVRPDLPAWFRIWVGIPDGLVRRQEMRTQGHIMDHAYSEFDQPISINPPT